MHALSCPTLYDTLDCSLPGSSVHGISQARILEWVATSFPRGSSQLRDWTRVSGVSCIGRRILPLSLLGPRSNSFTIFIFINSSVENNTIRPNWYFCSCLREDFLPEEINTTTSAETSNQFVFLKICTTLSVFEPSESSGQTNVFQVVYLENRIKITLTKRCYFVVMF